MTDLERTEHRTQDRIEIRYCWVGKKPTWEELYDLVVGLQAELAKLTPGE